MFHIIAPRVFDNDTVIKRGATKLKASSRRLSARVSILGHYMEDRILEEALLKLKLGLCNSKCDGSVSGLINQKLTLGLVKDFLGKEGKAVFI